MNHKRELFWSLFTGLMLGALVLCHYSPDQELTWLGLVMKTISNWIW